MSRDCISVCATLSFLCIFECMFAGLCTFACVPVLVSISMFLSVCVFMSF